jgi:fatty-acyl-CoA synthase
MTRPETDVPATASPAPSANRAWLRALDRTARLGETPGRLLAHVIETWTETQGEAPALLGDDETLSYDALAARTRAYARWGRAVGLAKGDVVALMAPNAPDYMATWLGLGRIGVVVALINTNLRGPALAHCLNVAAPRGVIVAETFAAALDEALAGGADALAVWRQDQLASAIADLGAAPLTPEESGDVTLSDPALLIYTSGTTGLPKAARVSHHRVMSWSGWFAGLMDAGPADRLYDCLPMYHSVGGVVATGALLATGGSVVLRERFSASRFWDEVVAWDCTLFQYIGELCRYLLAAPPSPAEGRHRLRLVCGNGLSGDIWTPFKDRFAIPRILEFYAATEGNFSLYNVEGEPGAIGRIPGFMSHRFPAALVRFDPATGAPARGEDGLCVRCTRGEAGEAIGRIGAGGDPAHRFEGYTSAAESEKKVLRDVFEPGDAWLRTGDLMRQDARGFYYFVDRVGDTFRWKGENVATTEVAQVLAAAPGVRAASVYGVEIPGHDGRAGMAALVVEDDFDLYTLAAHLAQRLPAYARPLLLRLTADLAMTETFKQKKADLARQGYDPAVVSDPLFLAQPEGYRALDGALFEALVAGAVRL